MPKPTMEASLAERNEENIYYFLTNLTTASVFQDMEATKSRSGLSDEKLAAIAESHLENITLADILDYANATNSYLDLNTDMDS
jgi:hypothetical protein